MRNRLVRQLLFAMGLRLTFLLPNHTNGGLVSQGEKRRYLLHVPGSYRPDRPSPLVISLHGYAESPWHQMQISRWNTLADKYGFVVVYPSGTGFPRHWRTAGESAQRDVSFISDLIDKLQDEYNLDPDRIYANGLSNGGGISFVLACRLGGRIAAIGSVSGAYLLPWSACRSSRPVPAILFHGTADPIVPFQGGPSNAFDIPFPAVPDWVEELARRNGCSAAPEVIPAQGAVSGVRYVGGPSTAEVLLYTIAGGGHTWPGGGNVPEWLAGATNRDIDASKMMWEFFAQHPLTRR